MSGVKRTFVAIAACTCLSAALPAGAAVPEPPKAELYNVLDDVYAGLPGPLAKERYRALEELRSTLNGVQLKLEWQKNGSFAFLRNEDVGAPLIRGFALPEARSAERAARSFLERYPGLFGLAPQELGTLVVDRNGVVGKTDFARGVYYVSFVQKIGGVRVHQARVTFAIHVDTGDLYAVTSSVFGSASSRSLRDFRLTPQQGAVKALSALGLKTGQVGRTVRKGDWLRVKIDGAPLDGPVSIKKTFLTARPGVLEPGYLAEVWSQEKGLIEVGISARDGRLLMSIPRQAHYSYKMSGWQDYPLAENGTIRSPTLMSVTPDAAASPNGWLAPKASDGKYRTVGPNVIAYYDWESLYNTFEFEEGAQALTIPSTSIQNPGTASEVVLFDYVSQWGTHEDPHTYASLSTTEIFRTLNQLHDDLYKLGFTPAQGNFSGDDPVIVNVQDGQDVNLANNANFATPADGTSGRMNMYIFNDEAGEIRDGSMDRQIFRHEMGHGLSHRLVNFGDNILYGAQSAALGEGHADVTAFTGEPLLQSRDDLFALASYVGWEFFTYVYRGPAITLWTGNFADDVEKPMGRFTAYTYELGTDAVNDDQAQRTYEHFGFIPIASRGFKRLGVLMGEWEYYAYPESHSDGEIWAAAMWRSWYRVNKHTWSSALSTRKKGFEQTALMGMQLMPVNPNFIQARDALIIYEELTQAESASCMIKYEFARTGMGRYAKGGADGSYGAKTDYDEATNSYPQIVPDFVSWGCAPGSYSAGSGDVTMIFSAPATELEVSLPTSLHLVAATPGYNTKATISGPYIGTQTIQSTSDALDKVINFTPTALGTATFTATVTSSKGETASQSVSVKIVKPAELDPLGDEVVDFVALGENDHYWLEIFGSDYLEGEGIQFTLKTLDNVDIDLYFNLEELALPASALGFDADEDGNESLKLVRLADGWQVVNASGTVFGIEPEGEDFSFYLNVAGFSASDYVFTVAPF